ncbi:hypothetical protein ACP3V5_17530 [Vibrio maritimus]
MIDNIVGIKVYKEDYINNVGKCYTQIAIFYIIIVFLLAFACIPEIDSEATGGTYIFLLFMRTLLSVIVLFVVATLTMSTVLKRVGMMFGYYIPLPDEDFAAWSDFDLLNTEQKKKLMKLASEHAEVHEFVGKIFEQDREPRYYEFKCLASIVTRKDEMETDRRFKSEFSEA